MLRNKLGARDSRLDWQPIIFSSLLLEGKDFSGLDDANWDNICRFEEIVFCRTTPEQKLKIVLEFQKRDYNVAVTGDGGEPPSPRSHHQSLTLARSQQSTTHLLSVRPTSESRW
mgnify:CR=1 FL=1